MIGNRSIREPRSMLAGIAMRAVSAVVLAGLALAAFYVGIAVYATIISVAG